MWLLFDLDYMPEEIFQKTYEKEIRNIFRGEKIKYDFRYMENTLPFHEEPCFYITDSDEGISRGNEISIPAIAWVHDEKLFESESLMGARWMIFSLSTLTKEYLDEIYAHYYKLPLMIAETKRCKIRELTMEDLEDLIALDHEGKEDGRFFSDNLLEQYLKEGLKKEEACIVCLKNYITHQYPFYRYGIYAVIAKETDKFIGIAGFSGDSRVPDGYQCMISYVIRSDYQGQGYATEVITELKNQAKKRFDMEDFIAIIDKKNTASLAVARKCCVEVLEK